MIRDGNNKLIFRCASAAIYGSQRNYKGTYISLDTLLTFFCHSKREPVFQNGAFHSTRLLPAISNAKETCTTLSAITLVLEKNSILFYNNVIQDNLTYLCLWHIIGFIYFGQILKTIFKFTLRGAYDITVNGI